MANMNFFSATRVEGGITLLAVSEEYRKETRRVVCFIPDPHGLIQGNYLGQWSGAEAQAWFEAWEYVTQGTVIPNRNYREFQKLWERGL